MTPPIQFNPAAAQQLAQMQAQQRMVQEQARAQQLAATHANGVQAPEAPGAAQGPQAVGSFGGVLDKFVQGVNDKQLESTQAVNDLLSGKNIPLHQVVIKMQEAGVAFQFMVEVRNKLLEGYQELMRMQV